MLSVLTISTLYPNPVQPAHGAFVAARLQHLIATREVISEVVAPVPWSPPWINYSSLGPLRRVPSTRMEGGITVHHPRYLVIPKIGMNITPHTMFHTLKKKLSELLAAGKRFDLIDAHYFYPDGVAAVWLGKHFGIPVTVTARGTDLNLIPQFDRPRKLIIEAAEGADGLITVCQALKSTLVDLGILEERVTVLRNGVDLDRFRPMNRQDVRRELGCTRLTLGSVGLLIDRKGHHHVIRALRSLPETDLLIVGDGPERASLQRLASQAGVAHRVRFLGLVDNKNLARIYNAMDALVLASSREGWANVLLEAMACGTPVVASNVWGTPEVVASSDAGVLMPTLDEQGVVDGVNQLFGNYPNRASTRRYAEHFSWDDTTRGQLKLFSRIIRARYPNNSA